MYSVQSPEDIQYSETTDRPSPNNIATKIEKKINWKQYYATTVWSNLIFGTNITIPILTTITTLTIVIPIPVTCLWLKNYTRIELKW